MANFENDVFLSYSHKDGESCAEFLECALNRAELSVWRDKSEIPYGPDFVTHLVRGLERSRTHVLIVTPEYLHSEWCLGEMFIGVANKSCLIVLSRGVSLDALPFNARTDNTAEYGTIEESGSELNRFCKSVSDLAGSRKSPLQIVEPSEQQDAGGTLDTVRAIQSLPFLRTRFDRPLSQAVTILSDSPLAEIGQALKEYSKPAHVRSGLWNLRLALEGTDATEREWWALAQLARPFNLVLRSEALARAKISPDQMRKQEGIDLSVVTPRRRRTPAKRGKFNTKQLRVLRQIKSVKPRIDESVPQPGTEDVVSEDRSLDPPVLLLPVERRDLWIRMWVGFLGLLLVVALEPFAIVMKHIRRGGCSWRTPLA